MSWTNWIVAADPGVTGAIAALNSETEELHLFDMPTRAHYLANPHGVRRKENLVDSERLFERLDPFVGADGAIEDVTSYGMKEFAAASVMRCKGSLETAFVAKRITVELIAPNAWKPFMLRGVGGFSAPKIESVNLARRLFPSAIKKLGTSHDGRAEALLMLYYKMLGDRKRHEHRALKSQSISWRPVRCELVSLNAKQLMIGGKS